MNSNHDKILDKPRMEKNFLSLRPAINSIHSGKMMTAVTISI